jgi:hypothetical protein
MPAISRIWNGRQGIQGSFRLALEDPFNRYFLPDQKIRKDRKVDPNIKDATDRFGQWKYQKYKFFSKEFAASPYARTGVCID